MGSISQVLTLTMLCLTRLVQMILACFLITEEIWMQCITFQIYTMKISGKTRVLVSQDIQNCCPMMNLLVAPPRQGTPSRTLLHSRILVNFLIMYKSGKVQSLIQNQGHHMQTPTGVMRGLNKVWIYPLVLHLKRNSRPQVEIVPHSLHNLCLTFHNLTWQLWTLQGNPPEYMISGR